MPGHVANAGKAVTDYGNHSANETCRPPMPESGSIMNYSTSPNERRTTAYSHGRDTGARPLSLDVLLPQQPTRHPADDISQSVSVSEIRGSAKVGQQLATGTCFVKNRPRHSTHERTSLLIRAQSTAQTDRRTCLQPLKTRYTSVPRVKKVSYIQNTLSINK